MESAMHARLPADAKVGQLDVAPVVEQHVGGLDVPVQDAALRVQVLQAVQHLRAAAAAAAMDTCRSGPQLWWQTLSGPQPGLKAMLRSRSVAGDMGTAAYWGDEQGQPIWVKGHIGRTHAHALHASTAPGTLAEQEADVSRRPCAPLDPKPCALNPRPGLRAWLTMRARKRSGTPGTRAYRSAREPRFMYSIAMVTAPLSKKDSWYCTMQACRQPRSVRSSPNTCARHRAGGAWADFAATPWASASSQAQGQLRHWAAAHRGSASDQPTAHLLARLWRAQVTLDDLWAAPASQRTGLAPRTRPEAAALALSTRKRPVGLCRTF